MFKLPLTIKVRKTAAGLGLVLGATDTTEGPVASSIKIKVCESWREKDGKMDRNGQKEQRDQRDQRGERG